ncbi:MAG: DUF7178 family protein [Silanimonas sp.]
MVPATTGREMVPAPRQPAGQPVDAEFSPVKQLAGPPRPALPYQPGVDPAGGPVVVDASGEARTPAQRGQPSVPPARAGTPEAARWAEQEMARQGISPQQAPAPAAPTLAKSGEPFKTELAAKAAIRLNKAYEGMQATKVPGGFGLVRPAPEPAPAPASRQTFADPDAVERQGLEQTFIRKGVAPDVAREMARDPEIRGAQVDDVTGAFDGRVGGMKAATVKRAIEHVARTSEPATFVSADIFNLGGLNTFHKNNASKANKDFRALTDLALNELRKTGGDVIPLRTGGDELGYVVVNASEQEVGAALERASEAARAYAERSGFANVPHTKEGRTEKGVGFHFGTSPITASQSVEDILDLADAGVDTSKNRGKTDVEGSAAQAPEAGQLGERPGGARSGAAGEAQQPAPEGGPTGGAVGRAGDAGAGDAGRGEAPRSGATSRNAPLPGAPRVAGSVVGPDPGLVDVAEQYARSAGTDLRRQAEFVKVDPERAARIASAYEAMPHAPQDPAVREAYDDLIRQTRAQYDALAAAGYSFTLFDSATDPYEGNPWNAMRDLRQNKRMAVYGTYDGFGTEGVTAGAVDDNPMLADTGLRWPDQNGVERAVLANDLFRAVHDAFGHGLEGAGFRAQGEENAWQAHVRLFTGPAVAAITTETRGQNSWLNYGPYGESNRAAKVEDTIFAEQKTGLMPEWTWQEGRAPDMPQENQRDQQAQFSRQAARPDGRGDGARRGGAARRAEAKPRQSFSDRPVQPDAVAAVARHYSNTAGLTSLDGRHYGTNHRGAEFARLKKLKPEQRGLRNRLYFYPDDSALAQRGESVVGRADVVRVQLDNLYDLNADPRGLKDRLAGIKSDDLYYNALEQTIIDEGFDGMIVNTPGREMIALLNTRPVPLDGAQSVRLSRVGAGKPASGRMRGEALRASIGRITKDWAVPVRVVDSTQDLPESIRSAPGFVEDGVDGVIDGEAIYLVANMIDSQADALRVLAHEGIGHFGMEGMLGERFDQVMLDVLAMRDRGEMAEIFAEVESRYSDGAGGYNADDATIAKEAIAIMAERGVKSDVVSKVMGALRTFFRSLGIKLDFSEADLSRMISDASAHVRSGGGRTGGDVNFSRSPAQVAGRASRYLTESELQKLRRDTAQKFVDIMKGLPSATEMANVALAGKAKRGWYAESSAAMLRVFGYDAPRFAGLLAATSPQTSVENNLLNALNIWANWSEAGRPTDRQEIVRIMGRSVQGSKGEDSVLGAWINNSVRALASEDIESLVISGPKVNSFMLNLRGFVNEVTNDAWMANYALVDQTIFSGSLTKGGDPGKGPGYLAMSARTRQAAEILTKMTGETWTPAEVQETVWSWAKTTYELASSKGESRSAVQLVLDGAITDDLIGATPAFGDLFHEAQYATILGKAGYDIGSRDESNDPAGQEEPGAQGQAATPAGFPDPKEVERAAKRLDKLRKQRASDSRVSFSRVIQKPFYSAMIRSVEAGTMPKKAGASAYKQWLDGAVRRGEFKQSERDWMGVDEWLASQKGDITKQQLVDFVRSNEVQVDEVVLGGRPASGRLNMDDFYEQEVYTDDYEDPDRAPIEAYSVQIPSAIEDKVEYLVIEGYADGTYELNDSGNVVWSEQFDGEPSEVQADFQPVIRRVERYITESYGLQFGQGDDPASAPKYSEYQLDGGKNYRELLLTLPASPIDTSGWTAEAVDGDPAAGPIWAVRDARGKWVLGVPREGGRRTAEEAITRAAATMRSSGRDYKSSHWDQPNVLAHMRFNEREDAGGNKTLFIEEIQSDWHQAGRKSGYRGGSTAARKALDEYRSQLRPRLRQRATEAGLPEPSLERLLGRTDSSIAEWLGEEDRLNELSTAASVSESGVPDAPLKSTDEWAMLAFKRAARWAVENGFDKIAWATGDQQADRYSLSQKLSKIYYSPSSEQLIAVGLDGDVVDRRRATKDELPSLVGEGVASSLISRPVDATGFTAIEGGDLRMGGEGMRGFYDKILPKAVGKWARKFGGEVSRSIIRTAPDDHGLRVTKLRGGDQWVVMDPDGIISSYSYTENGARAALAAKIQSEQHSVEITPDMRDAVLGGQPLFSRRQRPQEAAERLGEVGAMFRRTPVASDVRVPGAAWLGGKAADARPVWLKAMTRQQIVEVGKDQFNTDGSNLATEFEKLARRLDADATANITTPIGKGRRSVQKVAEDWASAASVFAGERKRQAAGDMAALMHDATIAGIDPAKPMPDGADEKAYRDLRRRWDALPKDLQSIYIDARDSYSKRQSEFYQALKDRIEEAQVDGKKKREMLDKLRQHFEAGRVKGVYFPLSRFGEYWVRAKRGDETVEFVMTERQQDQSAEAARLRAAGYSVTTGKSIRGLKSAMGPSAGFMGDIAKLIDAQKDSGEITAGVADAITDGIWQMYLQTLPEQSVRKHFIHRKGTPGFSQDALRAFATQMAHGGKQLARVRHSYKMAELLQKMVKHATERAPDGNKAADIVKALDSSFQWMMAPDQNSLANWMTSLGFMWYLGVSPAAALINTSQMAVVTLPTLAAKHGWARSGAALTRATKDYANSFFNKKAKDKLYAEYGGDLGRALEEMEESGAIDRTMTASLMEISDNSAIKMGSQKVMSAIGFLYHHAERLNRESTGIAAYRLARERKYSHEAAVEYAYEAIFGSHFDYSNANRAEFMRSNVAKVLLQFRQYSQNVTYFLWRNLHQTLKGESKEIRREAATKLFGTIGMTSLFAGAIGLPGYSMVIASLSAAHGLFGDDDEPYNPEVEFRKWLAENLGSAAPFAAKGAFNPTTGLDIAGRTGLGELWVRSPDVELEGKDLAFHYLEQAAGPSIGIFLNIPRAMGLLGQGETQRAAEQMTPKFVRDLIKAERYAEEGVQTLRGDPIIEQLSAWEILGQSQGFSPAELSEQYSRNNALKRAEQRVLDRRQGLVNLWWNARQSGDQQAVAEAMQAIVKFNKRWPAKAITADSLRRSMQSRLRYSRDAVDGVGIDPKLRRELLDMTSY